MLRICTVLLVGLSVHCASAEVFNESLLFEPKCQLNTKQLADLQQVQIEADLNNDGRKDIFSLIGKDEFFQTCLFVKRSKGGYELIHSHTGFYNTVLDLQGNKMPHLLVPRPLPKECQEMDGDNGEGLIPESLKPQIYEAYSQWTKGYEAFNYTYGMPEFYPIHNLFLLNETRVYLFLGQFKVDVTKEMTAYLDLKQKVLKAVISQDSVSPQCKAKLQSTLEGLNHLN